MTHVHAFGDDALAHHDAVGLVDALHARQVTTTEVVEAAIARTEAVNDRLNAVAYADFDGALERAADPRGGYFAGVPSFLKDNVDVAGMPTQQGTDAWEPAPRQVDGDFARMYLDTGLVCLGKTQLSEFGFSAAAEHARIGPVRSPWSLEHTAGASSSGSAALVAAGAVPIAHANDGGGSIRIPASVNGLVGLKPSRGRLPQDALMRQMPVRIIADGVVTRSVRDTAAFFREAERIYRNLRLPPVGDVTRPGRPRLRVAVVTEGIGRDATPEVEELTLKTAALLDELGHQVTPIGNPLPASLADDFLLYWSMLALVTVRSGKRSFGASWDPSRLDNLTHGLAAHSARNLRRLPGAIKRLRRTTRFSRDFFGDYDVLLTPTLAAETPRIGHLDPSQDYDTIMERLLDWVAFTPLQNATGDPAISLPLATTASGLPQGMMLSAGIGRESTLLALAYELEEAVPWARIDA
ncbi:amidase [Nocardioides sp.]|uniref:amidase n=1 Tax=Nocardioides sp. TaxID=35761 RepID=UPI002ED6ACD1